MTKRQKEIHNAYGQIIIGCVIGGAAYPAFLVPNSVAPGGVTGTAMLINHFTALPIGVLSLLMNIPIFVFGLKTIGKSFIFRSLLATVLFSVMIDILPIPAVTMDPLLGTLFGGIVLGIGSGLVVRGGATTGGSDMLAQIIHHRFSFITVGTALFCLETLVIIAAGFVFDATKALYALIEIFVCAKVIDMVLIGMSTNKSCFVITDKWEKVTARILNELERGVTHLNARGAYTNTERPVIMCVATAREVMQIKHIVSAEDPNAFVFVSDTNEVLGEGFSRLSE